MGNKCVVFLFNRDEFEQGKVEAFTYEECQEWDEPMSLAEFEESYNSEDAGDWATDFFVRIFPYDERVKVYLTLTEFEYPMTYTDGTSCIYTGNYLEFGDDTEPDVVALEDIPAGMLDELAEKTPHVERLPLDKFEKRYNDDDFGNYFPYSITFRET